MNRLTILSLIGTLSLGSAVSLQVQAAASDAEKEVAAMEQKWAEANRTNNTELETPLLAEKYVAVSSRGGKVFNKEQSIADDKASKYTSAKTEDLSVYVYGTTAIAVGVFTATGSGSDGKPIDAHVRFVDTWIKMPNGKWQVVASAGTSLKL